METGKFYHTNQLKLKQVETQGWAVALEICEKHIRWRLKQKTLSGAHSASNLGADPVDYYLGVAYEKILTGEWEWKEKYNLAQQLIRIADSQMSKEVEKAKSEKGKSSKVIYKETEEDFYHLEAAPDYQVGDEDEFYQRLKAVVIAVSGDEDLEFMIEALKEGKTRAEIAELMGLDVRKFDKLREKLLRRIRNHQTPSPKK